MGPFNLLVKAYATLKFDRVDIDYVAEFQQRRLRRLLKHAVARSEFYHNLYQGIDVANCRLTDLPSVTKTAMIDNWNRFVTDKRLIYSEIQNWRRDADNDGKRYLGEFIPIYTSGSSGEPTLIIYHRKALESVQANLFARSALSNKKMRAYDFAKMLVLRLSGRRVRMAGIAIPRGNMDVLFNNVPSLHNFFLKVNVLSSLDPIHRIVEVLNEFQPDCLISYPFLIALLAQEQLAGRLKIKFDHPLSFVAGGSEPLTEHTQKLAETAWNRRIRNIYGAVECFTMATSCRMFDRLHVMSHLCIIEIVDHDNNPVPPGRYGDKVLMTNLFNFAQPIIRYEIEDVTGYAEQSCECGSPFPTLLPVKGRTTDFMYFQKTRGGYERCHPYHLLVPLFYISDLRQYQIVQTARNELTLYYVSPKTAVDMEPQLTRALEDALTRAGIEGKLNIKYQQVPSISRDKRSGKFKMIKSMGAPADLDAFL